MCRSHLQSNMLKENDEETKRLIAILHLVLNNPYRPILKLFFKFQNINCANDTDISVILVYNVKFIENSNILYDFGIQSSNSREYLDVTKLYKSI